MKKFTGHTEPWGQFVDVKINAADLVPVSNRYRGKRILIASVTDAYMPLEKKYGLTRKVLEKLVRLQPALSILTKSNVVVRDIDILRQFNECDVGFTMTSTNAELGGQVEPGACTYQQRLEALKQVHQAGLTTYVFIAPLLPYLSDWQTIIRDTKPYTSYYMFDKLNIRGPLWPSIKVWLERYQPQLLDSYASILFSSNHTYWLSLKREIELFSKALGIESQIFFGPKPNKLQDLQQIKIF